MAEVVADEASVYETDALTATVVVAADTGRPRDAALAYGCRSIRSTPARATCRPRTAAMADRQMRSPAAARRPSKSRLAIRDGAAAVPRDLLRSIIQRWVDHPAEDDPGSRDRDGSVTVSSPAAKWRFCAGRRRSD